MKIGLYKTKKLMNLRIFTLFFLLLSTVAIGQNEGGFGGWGGPAGGGSPSGGGSFGGGGSSGGGMSGGITNAVVTITGRGGPRVTVHTSPGTYRGYAPPLPTITTAPNYSTPSRPSGGGNSGSQTPSSTPSSSSSDSGKVTKNGDVILLKKTINPKEEGFFRINVFQGDLPSSHTAFLQENGVTTGEVEFYRPVNGFFTRVRVKVYANSSVGINTLTTYNDSSNNTSRGQASDGSTVSTTTVNTNSPPPSSGGGDLRNPWSIAVGTDKGGGGSPGSPVKEADIISPPLDINQVACNVSCGGVFQYMEQMSLEGIKKAVKDCPCGLGLIEEKKRRLRVSDDEFKQYIEEILNSPPPAGANKFVYVDYENKIAEALEYAGGEDNLAIAQLFKNAAAKDAFLKATEQYKITQNGRNIIQVGEPIDLNWSKASLEQLRQVSEDASEVAVLEDNANNPFWPQNAEEWEAVLNVMAPLLLEVAIAFVPGSDVIELFRSLSNGDKIGVAIAVGGLIVDAVGGTAIKAAIKGAKIYKKATVIATKLGGAIISAGKAAKKGVKTTINSAGKLVLKKGDDVLESGGDNLVKQALEKISTPGARKFWTETTTFRNVKVYKRDDIINGSLVDNVGRTNKQRMQAGIAPIGSDGKSVNLHHMLQSDAAGIAEMTETFHKTNHKTVHINPNTIPSGIDRNAFKTWKRNYWKNRANDF